MNRISGTKNVWNVENPEEELDFIQTCIDDVIQTHPIDKERIYFVGFRYVILICMNCFVNRLQRKEKTELNNTDNDGFFIAI